MRSRTPVRPGLAALALLSSAACAGSSDDSSSTTAVTTAPVTTFDPPPTEPAAVSASTTSAPGDVGPTAPTTAHPVDTRCRPDPAGEVTDTPTTVTVWHGLGVDAADYLEQIANDYRAEFPDVDLVLRRIDTGYPGVLDELRATDPAQAPDVIMSSEQSVRLQVDSDRFVPVTECADGAVPDNFVDLLPVIARTYTVGGTLWAAPFNVSVPVMLYDSKRWERAGLDPTDPPTDIDGLEATIRALVDTGAATTGAVLYDRSAGWLIEEGAAQHGDLLVTPANGHDTTDINEVELEFPWTIDTLMRFRRLKQEGYIAWIGLNTNATEDLAQLVHPTEPSGLTFNTSAALGNILRLLDGGALPDVEVAVAPLPLGGIGATVGGGAWWLVDTGDPARIGSAWHFVDWITDPSRIAELAAYTGYIPTTERAAADPITLDSWEVHPIFRVAFDQAAATPDTDAAAGLQVGPNIDVFRDIELAAAFTIDAGDDPTTRLQLQEELIAQLLDTYAATFDD